MALVGIAVLIVGLVAVDILQTMTATGALRPGAGPGFFQSIRPAEEPSPSRAPCPVLAIEQPRGWVATCDARFGVQFAHPRDSDPTVTVTDAAAVGFLTGCQFPVSTGGGVACLWLPSGHGAKNMDGTLFFQLPAAPDGGYLAITARAVDLPALAATLAFYDPDRPIRRTGLLAWRTAVDSPASGALRCHTKALTIEFVRKGQAMNHTRLDYRLTNTSDVPCQLFGWPGLQMQGPDGSDLPTDGRRVASTFMSVGVTGPMLVTLPAGGAAYVELDPATPAQSGPCVSPSRVLVTPPDEYTPLLVAGATFGEVCLGGQVQVLPVFPVEV